MRRTRTVSGGWGDETHANNEWGYEPDRPHTRAHIHAHIHTNTYTHTHTGAATVSAAPAEVPAEEEEDGNTASAIEFFGNRMQSLLAARPTAGAAKDYANVGAGPVVLAWWCFSVSSLDPQHLQMPPNLDRCLPSAGVRGDANVGAGFLLSVQVMVLVRASIGGEGS